MKVFFATTAWGPHIPKVRSWSYGLHNNCHFKYQTDFVCVCVCVLELLFLNRPALDCDVHPNGYLCIKLKLFCFLQGWAPADLEREASLRNEADEAPTTSAKDTVEEKRIKKIKQKTEVDSYAECYPG